MLIQTFLPEHKLFTHLQKNSIEKFYEEELAVRQSLNLPPFAISHSRVQHQEQEYPRQ
jgi:primosomal protein N'